MYLHELSAEIKKGVNKDELIDSIWHIINSYYTNGQSLGINSEMYYFEGNKVIFLMRTLEKSSLRKSLNNYYVKHHTKKTQETFKTKITIKFKSKTYIDSLDACTCKKTSYYTLFTYFVDVSSPLNCGECHMPVPLYRLPKYNDHNYHEILRWQSDYIHCDSLQMGCRVGERWALNQMQNLDSELSKSGLEICNKIKELTGIPVYYYIYDYRKNTGQKEKLCPGCGKKWKLNKRLHDFYDYKCDHCLLLSTISPNS